MTVLSRPENTLVINSVICLINTVELELIFKRNENVPSFWNRQYAKKGKESQIQLYFLKFKLHLVLIEFAPNG